MILMAEVMAVFAQRFAARFAHRAKRARRTAVASSPARGRLPAGPAQRLAARMRRMKAERIDATTFSTSSMPGASPSSITRSTSLPSSWL